MEKIKEIDFPQGYLCSYCCGDCVYMDLNYTNNYNDAWCGKYNTYYSPSADASSCSYFSQR